MFRWRFSIYSLSLFIRYILINQCGCAAFQKRWNSSDLWTSTATWGVCQCPAPEGGRLGPSQVRQGPAPGSRGPRRQVGEVEFPPYRHPPEVVAALAAHGVGFAPGFTLSPALVWTQVRARRAPFGHPDPGGCCLHASAPRDRRGATPGLLCAGTPLLQRLLRKCLLVPSFPGRSGPRRKSGTRSLRLPHSPDAATAVARRGLPPPPPL